MSNVIAAVVSLFLGLILQLGLAPHMAVFGVRPQLGLTTALCLALLLSTGPAIITAFFYALFLTASYGTNIGLPAFGSMLACLVINRIKNQDQEIQPLTGSLLVGLGSAIANVVLLFGQPASSIVQSLQTNLASAVYNALLAFPLLLLLRKFILQREPGV